MFVFVFNDYVIPYYYCIVFTVSLSLTGWHILHLLFVPSERVRRDVLAVTIDNGPLAYNTTEQKNDGDDDGDDDGDNDDDNPYHKATTAENTITGDSPGTSLLCTRLY